MKTYGRSARRVYEDDRHRAAKKRRVQEAEESDDAESNLQYAIRESAGRVMMSSSPSRRNSTIFSESTQEDDELSTPPSSPPPRLSPPLVNTRKPTFSFLKRKRAANGQSPLTEVNSNTVRSSTETFKKESQAPVLRQLQIDAGVTVRRSCSTCGTLSLFHEEGDLQTRVPFDC